MSDAKKRTAAVEGWMQLGTSGQAGFALIGTRCLDCGTYFFPKEMVFCRNPSCAGSKFEEVPLSRRGVLWSFTNNCYPPPAPYIAADPFEPYAIAAVELEEEKMVVLGQLAGGIGVESLAAGMEMELVEGTLYEDDDNEYVVWNWKPVAA